MFDNYMLLALILLFIGLVGVVVRKNIFTIFMSVELMLNAVALIFASIARAQGSMEGQVIVLLIIALAAAEAAFGLALIVLMHKEKQSLNIEDFNELRTEQC